MASASRSWSGQDRLDYPFGTGRPPMLGGPALQAMNGGVERGVQWPMLLASIGRLSPDFGGQEEIQRPYEENVWVHVALKVFADAVSQVRPILWTSDEDEAERVPDDHPLVRLFRRPNPLMSRSKFFIAEVINRRLDGENFWFMTDDAGEPLAASSGDEIDFPSKLWPIRGSIVEVERDKNNVPRAWRYKRTGGQSSQTFPNHSVLHLSDYDPNDITRGLGDVGVLSRQLVIQFQAERYQEGVLRNSGDPGGFIKLKGTIRDEERNRVEQEAKDRFGQAANRGDWKVIDDTAEYVPNKLTPKDMEYSVLLKHTRDTIIALLGVPGPLVGVWENSTYNNMREAKRALWTGGNGVISFLRTIEDALDAFFFPRLRDREARGFVLRFDIGSVEALREETIDKVRLAKEVVQAGIGVSFHEASGLVGIEVDPLEHGDDHFFSPLLISGSSESDDVPEPEAMGAREDGGEAHRREFWRRFEERVLLPNDKRIFGAARRYLSKYRDGQLNRLKELAGGKSGRSASNAITESELARMLLDQDEWIGKMRELLGPKLAESYVLALAEAALDLGGAQLLISDPQVVLALAQQELQLVEGVTSTLSKKVKRALLEVFTSADPPVVGTLQHVISELLPELTGTLKVAFRDVNSRALAIARTESAHAANTARFMHMEKEKIDRHEWISSGDEFVRESHARVNGEIKALGDRFSNGMRHPHDPSGPASEVVNCRCVTEAVIG